MKICPTAPKLAYREDGAEDIARCGFFWLGGFKSDMEGSKAEALAALARDTRRPGFRFDYSGHGASGGEFLDGTISGWLAQSLHMFTRKAPGRRIVVGSSMGGWLALLLYRELRIRNPRAADRIAGLVLLAPAADMTADLMWDQFPDEVRAEILSDRRLAAPLALWRALCHHPPPDRGRRQAPDAGGGAGRRLPGAHPAGRCRPDVPAAHAVKVFGALQRART